MDEWIGRFGVSITPPPHHSITPPLPPSQPIEDINQLPKPPVLAPIKPKTNSRQLDIILIGQFLWCRVDPRDAWSDNNIRKILVHRGNRRIAGRVLQPNDKELLDEAARMKITIKKRDNFYCLVGIIGDLIQIKVIGRNQLVAQ